ncbi:hypothetical protein [Paenisporosarcina sp.]|uniref:hypothetical protein n=1 Tax=Paenisporosarcina sp. TaxID=1932001 RepID=UPI003C730AFF
MKKVLAIILSTTVLLGAGTIYANVDSSSNLSNWYNHSFQKESSDLSAETEAGIWKTFDMTKGFVEGSNEKSDRSIKNFTESRVKKSNNEIDNYKKAIENQLNWEVSNLKKENFDNFAKNAKLEEDLEQSLEDILKEVLTVPSDTEK